MAKVTIKRTLPATIDFEGAKIQIAVTRMPFDEFLAFEEEFFKWSRPAPGDEEATPEQEKQRAIEMLAWLQDSFARHVTLAPGEVDDVDGSPIVDGRRFYDVVSGQMEVKIAVVGQIWNQNRYAEELRKNSASPSGSATTSHGPSPEARGLTPEPTVESAGTPVSAPTAAVAPAAP